MVIIEGNRRRIRKGWALLSCSKFAFLLILLAHETATCTAFISHTSALGPNKLLASIQHGHLAVGLKSRRSSVIYESRTPTDDHQSPGSENRPTRQEPSSEEETVDTETLSARQKLQIRIKEAQEQLHALKASSKDQDTPTELDQAHFDSLIAACVAYDEWDAVLDVLQLMNQFGLRQVQSTYRACLQACFEVSNAASANEILRAMEQARMQPEPTDVGLVVATMCRNEKVERGWWRRALKLANNQDTLPVAAYDALLSCMIDERQWKEAVRLLRLIEDDAETEPTLSIYRAVIECCTVAQQPEQAVQVLNQCVARGLTPTVYAFELVISALSKPLKWRRALQLLDLMEELEVPRTLMIYNTILAACAKTREVVQAKTLLVRMRRDNIKPNIVSFNYVMTACASTSRWKDSLHILDQIHREPGVSPDIFSYTNAIRACGKGGKTRQALTLLQVVKDREMKLDAYCYTAAIEACAKAGMWMRALELLEEMENEGVSPSEVTYSVSITACGNGGQWQKALDLLQQMRERNLRVNLITYNAAITAISKAAKQIAKWESNGNASMDTNDQQLWSIALDILDQMKKDGIEPDGFSFSSAISCCGSQGRWEEALELIELMQKGGPKTRPNKIAYTAAIASCGRSGQADHALDLFRRMKDQGLSADRVAYNALFSALRIARKPNTAIDLWDEMLGTRQSNTTKIATAREDASSTPDIITITDAIAAIASRDDEGQDYRQKIDEIFVEAVRRGIVLRTGTLDSFWEVDLSGMSLQVARAACRYVLNRILITYEVDELQEVTFITGVGVGKRPTGKRQTDQSEAEERSGTSLREYIQEVLERDFRPPLSSSIPKYAQGTVEVSTEELLRWFKINQKQM